MPPRSPFRLPIRLLLLLTTLAGCSSDPPPSDSADTANQAPPAATSTEDTEQKATVPRADDPQSPPQEQTAFEYIPPQLTNEELAGGWVALFDQATLFGWVPGSEAHWTVNDRVLECSEGPAGLLLTPFEIGDFELRCEFWLEPGGNSGVFLRTKRQPAVVDQDCYELNICDSHDSFPTASLVGRHRCEPVPKVEGAWHRFHVRCAGRQITVQLDEQTVVDFTDETDGYRKTGHIGLQMNAGHIKFRNVFVRPLAAQSITPDETLTGWEVVPESEAEFTAGDGEVQVSGGPGFLETNDVYGDFILQFEARTGVENTNSGVFFRAEKGTVETPSNGYELQLCNSIADGDRTRPNDYQTGYGTGAIFRFQKARWVVPNDQEWFHVTLIAQGPRFMTYVNGYPVADWIDTREPNSNPRRGRRLEAGHLSLQGHDPETRIAFRNIRVQLLD